MSRLSLAKIENQDVMMRDGVSLHSRKDPVREAQIWAEAQSAILKAASTYGPVFILGAGAGHHIRALSEMRPELHLVAVDFDTELLGYLTEFELILGFEESLKSDAPMGLIIAVEASVPDAEKRNIFGKGFSVLRFRPAWSGFEAQFAALGSSLLDATPEALIPWYAARGQATGFTETTEELSTLSEEEKLILALKEVVV